MTSSVDKSSMYLIYIDESYDQSHFVYSALFIDAFHWNKHFNYLKNWRQEWFEKYQVPLEKELHATEFVGGRGRPNSKGNKELRAKLFKEAIGRVEEMKDVKIINGVTKNKKQHKKLFEWMLTRINNTLKKQNAFGILICDEGNENALTAIVRKMQKSNPIPNRSDMYVHGRRNLPLERIIEAPLFKGSKSSYFI